MYSASTIQLTVSFSLLTKESSTKQLYLSPRYKGLGNAMNYLKDHVTYYNDWLDRNFPFYKINRFQ